ncbi:stilbene synthase [Paenibacillus swuensis]|uniref:Stilbene synthase n=1 Tax=Paenibacillus swuensis TaxID=1178515 RepID=A0A172TNI5_9BACL|nr:type III polyketide synthase [Paenibacillus swuensis]ANE48580.1 stilbene synthase [Paenibacillus swuensis]
MRTISLAPAILGLGTALPPHKVNQAEAATRLADALSEDRDASRWARRIFNQCGVDTRYTCEPNLLEPAPRSMYLPGTPEDKIPTTAERMGLYKQASVELGYMAAVRALIDSALDADDITHLITVTCTGLFLPGLDAALIRGLGLSNDVERIPLQYLGCAAGLKAVCLARQIADRQPRAHVLIVCVELCTLHIQPSSSKEDLYAAAFFGDGASACVVGGAESRRGRDGVFELGEHRSVLLPDSSDEMTWEIGNYGFSLYLSPRIPEWIGAYLPLEIKVLLKEEEWPELWAIHPGGRGIIDAVEKGMGLTSEQTRVSREVLRKVGNLSSATIIYVLQDMRRELNASSARRSSGVAAAFGPGLTAELLKFHYVPGIMSSHSQPEDACYHV